MHFFLENMATQHLKEVFLACAVLFIVVVEVIQHTNVTTWQNLNAKTEPVVKVNVTTWRDLDTKTVDYVELKQMKHKPVLKGEQHQITNGIINHNGSKVDEGNQNFVKRLPQALIVGASKCGTGKHYEMNYNSLRPAL